MTKQIHIIPASHSSPFIPHLGGKESLSQIPNTALKGRRDGNQPMNARRNPVYLPLSVCLILTLPSFCNPLATSQALSGLSSA